MASEYLLGPFRLDLHARRVTRDGAPVAIGERAFDVLAMLAAADGAIVSKDALLDGVWASVAVAEDNLHAQVSALRRALGDDIIATVPRRGYRLAVVDGTASRPDGGIGDAPGIAVMPFASEGGPAAMAYFAAGLCDEIALALGRNRFCRVVMPVDIPFSAPDRNARGAAHRHGVRYAVDGRVRCDGERIRIVVRVSELSGGALLWGEHFEGTTSEVFTLQDRVAASVAAMAVPRVIRAEILAAQHRQPGAAMPYDLLLRGLSHHAPRTRRGTEEAIGLLRRAVALDPGHALAHAHLAYHMWWMVAQGWLHAEHPLVADMLGEAQIALLLDAEHPEVLLLASVIVASRGGNLDGGIVMINRSLHLNPNSAVAYRMMGVLQSYAGDAQAAFACLAQADELNRFDRGLMPNHAHYLALFCAGNHDAVVASTGIVLAEQPNFIPALRWRAASLGQIGAIAEGRAVVERICGLAPGFTLGWLRRYLEVDMNSIFKSPGMVDAFHKGLRHLGMPDA